MVLCGVTLGFPPAQSAQHPTSTTSLTKFVIVEKGRALTLISSPQTLLGLVKIYIQYYKSGSFPTITKTRVTPTTLHPSLPLTSFVAEAFYWYRPHPKSAVASSDALGRPSNSDWTEDSIYVAVVVAKSSSVRKLRIKIGGSSTTSSLKTGKVNLVKVPFGAGIPIFASRHFR